MTTLHVLELVTNCDRKEAIKSLLHHASTGELTILAGAGISRSSPSLLPLSNEVVRAASRALATKVAIPVEALYTHDGKPMRLEPFLRVIQAVCSETAVEDLLAIFASGKPNINHHSIARLLKNEPSNGFICLNFDQLIEKAIAEACSLWPQVIVPDQGTEIVLPSKKIRGQDRKNVVLAPSRPSIIKPHGTIMEGGGSLGIVATIQALGQGIPRELEKRMRNLINGRALLVVGYSNDDIDITPFLTKTRPDFIYWNTLSGEIPALIQGWIEGLTNQVSATHLRGRCELFFEGVNNYVFKPMANAPPVDIDLYVNHWLQGFSDDASITTICAWIAQDRHRIQTSMQLYLTALESKQSIKNIVLRRFIRYRYAEFLRHQAEEKRLAIKELIILMVESFNSPVDLPQAHAVLRSFAGLARSLSHHSDYRVIAWGYAFIAGLTIIAAMAVRALVPAKKSGKFYLGGEKSGNWIQWEIAMILLGVALRSSWRKLKRPLLIAAYRKFKVAGCSTSIYESSAGVFGQARSLAALGRLEQRAKLYKAANFRLDKAVNLFEILDDVTGLKNADKLRLAIETRGLDPWIS